jgi:ribosomal RNA assembly protein
MDSFEYVVKVPKERVAVIIGEKGAKKRELEEHLAVRLDIDSEEGEVRLRGEDSVKLFSAQDVIKAIARGFNPDIALQLLKTDYVLEVLTITDYAKSKDQMARLKGRVIGEAGKARKTVEDLAGVSVSVYGKTVAVIGEAVAVDAAKRGIDMLLTGAPHATVFRVLERWRRDQRRKDSLPTEQE